MTQIHTAPVSFHSLTRTLGKLHTAPGWSRLPEGNTEVEGYQSNILIKSPTGRSRQRRTAFQTEITFICHLFQLQAPRGEREACPGSLETCEAVAHTATKVLSSFSSHPHTRRFWAHGPLEYMNTQDDGGATELIGAHMEKHFHLTQLPKSKWQTPTLERDKSRNAERKSGEEGMWTNTPSWLRHYYCLTIIPPTQPDS